MYLNNMSNDIIAELVARVQALEARLNDLCPPPNLSRVAPEGVTISPFDVKRRIEAMEDVNGTYYGNWPGYHYAELAIGDHYVKREYGNAMFDEIYYMIPRMTALKKLKMVSHSGAPLGFGLTVLPDIHYIHNPFVEEMHICAGFDFIPYLQNFPSLRRLEIVNHPYRTNLNKNFDKKQRIYMYCEENGIQLLCC
jgi:hypothetical protein